DLERSHEAVQTLPVGGAQVDRHADPAGDDVHRARLDVHLADGADCALRRSRQIPDAEDELGSGCEGVGAPGHRDGAGVAGLAGEDALAADDADDALSEPERHARTLEHRALLDVHLEEAFRQRPPFDELRTPDAAAFLVTEDDGRPAADPTDGLDRGDHAERAVELAAVRHGVEVRAAPDAGIRRAADQVPGGVDLHVEPRVAHPLRRELVRPVLPLAPPDAVRAAAAAD